MPLQLRVMNTNGTAGHFHAVANKIEGVAPRLWSGIFEKPMFMKKRKSMFTVTLWLATEYVLREKL